MHQPQVVATNALLTHRMRIDAFKENDTPSTVPSGEVQPIVVKLHSGDYVSWGCRIPGGR